MLSSVLLAILLPSLAFTQSIYINRVPSYTSLACCAQAPLSVIVRDMSKGCGDGNALTSYACFCTASSSYISEQISSYAYSACNSNDVQADQAVEVFDSYCAVGTETSQEPVARITSAALCTDGTSTSTTARAAATRVITTIASVTAPPPASTTTATGSADLRSTLGLEQCMLGVLAAGVLTGCSWF